MNSKIGFTTNEIPEKPTGVNRNSVDFTDSLANGRSEDDVPEIIFITSYPPRECGIATYSQDLLRALQKQFIDSFRIKICAIETDSHRYQYPAEVRYTLNSNDKMSYSKLAKKLNNDKSLSIVLVQHEFGLFQGIAHDDLLHLLSSLTTPIVIVFHTVLSAPDKIMLQKVRQLSHICGTIVVMTNNSARILNEEYSINFQKITVIAHGTHLVPHHDKNVLKEQYGLSGKKILSTFGLLNSGKGIEITLDSLPSIIKNNPETLFLILGKTHPGVVLLEGEQYREMLEKKVERLGLQHHVKFVNKYLPLKDLLDYLQLSDIYLFTSTDPNQAVSGTFSYAMSCGCPIISTPFPQAKEQLYPDSGIMFPFNNSNQLTAAVNLLINNEQLLATFGSNILQRILPTAWENSAIAHAQLFKKFHNYKSISSLDGEFKSNNGESQEQIFSLHFRVPEINLTHVKKMTTAIGIIQFAAVNIPDEGSGYTLDDNARALITMCMHYELTGSVEDLKLLKVYLNFIDFCQTPSGKFQNYLNAARKFTDQNMENSLDDANGRAMWALGYLISRGTELPIELTVKAEWLFNRALPHIVNIYSTRAMAFTIKGLYYNNIVKRSPFTTMIIKILANRLVQMYRHESAQDWRWFESYLTYGNSVIPEALLCAWLDTGGIYYKQIAIDSFDFLLNIFFKDDSTTIKVISNVSWLKRGEISEDFGEQPIDVVYTILALRKFYEVFGHTLYAEKMQSAFGWFLGNNHLHQIVYNPCTGGCYDGLEQNSINVNQGAESTIGYLLARLTITKTFSIANGKSLINELYPLQKSPRLTEHIIS